MKIILFELMRKIALILFTVLLFMGCTKPEAELALNQEEILDTKAYRLIAKEYLLGQTKFFELYSEGSSCGCYADSCYLDIKDDTGELIEHLETKHEGPCDVFDDFTGTPIAWNDEQSLIIKSYPLGTVSGFSYSVFNLETKEQKTVWQYSSMNSFIPPIQELFFNDNRYFIDQSSNSDLVKFYKIKANDFYSSDDGENYTINYENLEEVASFSNTGELLVDESNYETMSLSLGDQKIVLEDEMQFKKNR